MVGGHPSISFVKFCQMSKLTFHNTLTGKKETFQPLKKGKATLYVCGITPYDKVHLGHARCYVVFDVVKRVLRHKGYNVHHVQNFTDVDDKIIERANKENTKPSDWAKKNIDGYFHWMDKLHVERAGDYPCVTNKIPEIQDLISKLVEKGMAYAAGGDVFYSVRKFKGYGQLSKRKVDELEAGARVEVDEKKKDPLDFALWKKVKPGEPAWDSPWGKGRPGWHIECSAMSMNLLGETFDIHGGGQDLIFPHHENEIAQSNGATGKEDGFARFWIHNGFVTINKQKMSKSLGNFFTLEEILAKYDPMSVRYFLISQHYRSPLNFSDQDLSAAQTSWRQRILGIKEKIDSHRNQAKGTLDWASLSRKDMDKFVNSFFEALYDDLNTPAALGFLNQYCNKIFQLNDTEALNLRKENWETLQSNFLSMVDVLGLKFPGEEQWDALILDIAKQREAARQAKDWKKADDLRTKLKKHGVLVEDTSKGPKLRRV